MEEELIYEIVDCIVNNQDKIKELTHQIESPEENEIFKKEIQYKNSLSSNIKRINRYENDIKINDKKFKAYSNNFYNKMENIENEIESISNKLNEFDKKNNDKELYKISYEKFKKILLNKQDKKNLKHSQSEYNHINDDFLKLSKDMKNIEEEKNELNEMNSMLEEEKERIELKMFDYMTLKESYEEISKQYLKQYFFQDMNIGEGKNNDNNIINEINESKDIRNISLKYFELNYIDFNKLSQEMSSQIIYLINHEIKSNKIDNNDIINIKSYDNIIKSSDDKDLAKRLENNNNILFHSFVNKTKNIYDKQEVSSLSCILASKIEKKLIDFIVSSNNYVNNNNDIDKIDNLIILLNDLIVSFIKIYFPSFINENKNNSNFLKLFIKCLMKSFYYQKIISNDFIFLNEEYKRSKKEIQNKINKIEKKIDKIKNKKEEILILKEELEEKIKYLNDNINNNIYSELSPEEKEYIILSQKLDELTLTKKKLKYNFIKYENEISYNIEKLSYKIEELKTNNKILRKNILACQEEIKLKNHQNKLEIDKLEKSIKDKFNVIKGQIAVYKKKNGDNIVLYNKFVNRINETLNETENNEIKKVYNYNRNNNYSSNNNSLHNTQSTFYKSNEKQNLMKGIFPTEKMYLNNYNNNINFY